MAFCDQIVGFEPVENYLETVSSDRVDLAMVRGQPIKPEYQIELSAEDSSLKVGDSECKITLPIFPIERPWLPPKAIGILEKIKKGSISESDATTLMQIVADQATEHFHLECGKFIASTFLGRIVETGNSRTDLLKKIQGQPFKEELFVWRVGADSFSGRL